jgi:hypothetical protein
LTFQPLTVSPPEKKCTSLYARPIPAFDLAVEISANNLTTSSNSAPFAFPRSKTAPRHQNQEPGTRNQELPSDNNAPHASRRFFRDTLSTHAFSDSFSEKPAQIFRALSHVSHTRSSSNVCLELQSLQHSKVTPSHEHRLQTRHPNPTRLHFFRSKSGPARSMSGVRGVLRNRSDLTHCLTREIIRRGWEHKRGTPKPLFSRALPQPNNPQPLTRNYFSQHFSTKNRKNPRRVPLVARPPCEFGITRRIILKSLRQYPRPWCHGQQPFAARAKSEFASR